LLRCAIAVPLWDVVSGRRFALPQLRVVLAGTTYLSGLSRRS
jgi:hypothetical protein